MSDSRGETLSEVDGDDGPLADWVAELVERLEQGEPVDASALAADHPERADELRRVLPTIHRMASFGRAVARMPVESRATIPADHGPELGMLGDFRLLREVGRGGMGIVYEAEQVSLGRRVALKILPLAGALDPRQHQRFLLEARAAACLHHAHIVPVHAVGSERGVPYYAMQFIDGCTLAEVLSQLREGDLDEPLGTTSEPAASLTLGTSSRDRKYIRAVAEQGRRIAEALDHAHGRGIIHRDIKPANLMLDAASHLWITDFGLAQIQGDSRLTITGDILGTLRYMSPEQALARRVVIDGRTDIYSLGATLFELLALRPVFDGGDRGEILRKIAQDEPTPLRAVNPAVPRDLATIVHKTLAKEPLGRYATARELADDLGRFLDARPIAARPPGRRERLAKWSRRNRAIVVPALLFGALALVASAGGLLWSNDWLSRHNARLRVERDHAKELSDQLREQRDLAESRRRLADRHLAAFRLRQADEALRAREFEDAQEILRESRPAPGEEDHRGLAWHYLWRESRREVAVLSERDEQVWSLAVSPDGRTVATGDRDGTIRLRDAATGDLRARFRGHGIPIGALAFSADGRWLASGTGLGPDGHVASQGELLLWDTASGRQLASLDGFGGRAVGSIRFDRSGRSLWERSVTSTESQIGRWDLGGDIDAPRPRLVRRWASGPNLAASVESARVVANEDEGRVVAVIDANTDRVLLRSPRWDRTYGCAAISADGRLVATVAIYARPNDLDELAVWDVETGQPVIDPRSGPWVLVDKLEFAPDGGALVAASSRGALHHISLKTGDAWVVDLDHRDGGLSNGEFCILPGDVLLAWSYRGERTGPRPLRILERSGGAIRAEYPGHLDTFDSLLGLAGGRSLVFRSGQRAIAWHFETSADPQPSGHTDEAWAVGFSDDGHLLATGCDDPGDPKTLKLWDSETGRLVRGWKAHATTTAAVAFQPGGRVLATGGLCPEANLRLWDIATGNLLATLDGHTDKVRTVAFSPDGHLLASAGTDRTIRLWDVATRRCLRTFAGHTDVIRQVAFAPDGRAIVSVGNDCSVRLWRLGGPEPGWTWTGGVKIASVAFSPDGRTLAWAHEDGVIQRWDLDGQIAYDPVHSEHGELRCIAFSPDGRTLAAAGQSGDIHLWDPEIGQELLTLDGRPCQLNALSFSPDGSALAACWHDGTVKLIRGR